MKSVTGSVTNTSGATSPSSGGEVRSAGWLIAASVALLVCLYLAFRQFFDAQIRFAITEPADWGHTLVIPLIAGWFLWLKRGEILEKPLRPAWIGVLLVVAGVGWFTFCSIGPKPVVHHLTRAAGLFVTVCGLVVLFGGWRVLWLAAFPLLYMFAFGVTISDRIMHRVTYALQDVSAVGAYLLLRVLGIDADRGGNVLTVYDQLGTPHPLNVAEACSGMRMLVAFLALGTAMAYVGLPRLWQRVLVVLLGVPIAVFVNVLRVATLGLLSLRDIAFAAGDFHHFIGLVWLVPAFLLFLLLIWVVRNAVVETEDTIAQGETEGTPPVRFARPIMPRVAAACAALVVAAVGLQFAVASLNVFLSKKEVELRASLDTIPTQLGSWKRVGEDVILSDAMVEELGTRSYIDRMYVNRTGDGRMNLHLAYYSGTIDDVPHIPERCWNANGLEPIGAGLTAPLAVDDSDWTRGDAPVNGPTGLVYPAIEVAHPVTGRIERLHMPVGDFELRLTLFTDPRSPNVRTVGGYFFVANGRLTASSLGVRSLAFNLTDEYAYYCKVQFSARFEGKSDDAIVEEYVGQVSEMLDDLLPPLMRCLPDWPAVEAGELEDT